MTTPDCGTCDRGECPDHGQPHNLRTVPADECDAMPAIPCEFYDPAADQCRVVRLFCDEIGAEKVMGQWPGDETDEEIEAGLAAMDGRCGGAETAIRYALTQVLDETHERAAADCPVPANYAEDALRRVYRAGWFDGRAATLGPIQGRIAGLLHALDVATKAAP